MENINNNNEKVYTIEELNIDQNSFILTSSKRNSGKSILVKNLIHYLTENFEYDYMLLFTDTFFNGDYNNIFKKECVYKSEELDEKIKKLLLLLEKNINKGKYIKGLIVLDDVKTFNNSKMLIQLACQSRHFLISVICSVQYPKQLISSSIRSNIDYLFCGDLNEQGIQAIYQCIHTPLNYKQFLQYVDKNNINYQFIFYSSKEMDKKLRLKICKSRMFNNLQLLEK